MFPARLHTASTCNSKQYVVTTSRRICLRVNAAVAIAPVADAVRKPNFPFVRIAGQEEMKLAICLNVVDPNIGGVLIMGDRGTGKSVTVRAMVDLLPMIDVVEGDPFNSDPYDPNLMGPDARMRYRNGDKLTVAKAKTPLVELPLGATEDRICGTIDIEKALSEGVKAYEPGLLAKANRGILYVDEVNLLDDGLVDVVLDSAASGINTVEREGISIVHPAKFIMVGSGNPAEGELRPQLLDRFGMSVQVQTIQDGALRTQMVLDRMAYEQDPDALCASARPQMEELQKKLEDARKRLKAGVRISDKLRLLISDVCSRLNVDGLRGDIVVNRAAKALVAYEGRNEVKEDDIERVISLCLNHRLRKDPLDPIDNGTKVRILFKRLSDPEFLRREEEAKRKAEEAKAKAEAAQGSGKKAGAWGGLPGRK
ncbi:hypothetical protein CEUSTIGMA_g5566.t1 [Chlamydomonas eustigma]|uniref:Mg-protoporphyrin IX chelatase n=1 Tax=Chlamydomonas eustigma TaxID=1157962 RepID=A0A250X4W4_9CHLO|nr:hypothetical protein CEUSTIGMA_g5566.t1 [Chlamydomonas eustigma]|eukprot:GAX78124.1 hypothetical protein CEUSTIGMA_g5566.t1 [Chlamydomonas eustigma]